MLSSEANSQANDIKPSPGLYEAGARIAVLLPLPLGSAYDYRVPPGLSLADGDFVRVPLGNRRAVGVVWGAGAGDVDPAKCREVIERLNVPPLPEPSRKMVDWVAAYTMSASGAVLKMAMSVPAALEPPPKGPVGYVAAAQLPADLKLTDARKRVLDAAWAPHQAADLARLAGSSPAVIKGLAEAGALLPVPLPRFKPPADPQHAMPGPTLSGEQAEAARAMCESIKAGFSVMLLEGVTGSGKTEVYFEAVAEALAQGKQVLVLLPEIALSAQWLSRFERRFGTRPLEWHSDLSDTARRETWRLAAEGRARVVVGARSALFLPYPELGLIVVDEEHDASFKQEEGVIYHARDMAVVRARVGAIPVVLASATPSLETQANVQAGRYRKLHLPNRHGGAELPEMALIDLRRHPPARRSWLSPLLLQAVSETIAAGEQALLFLNRRGYAPLTLCNACGYRLQCPHCTAWLVEHRGIGRLQCHHCGYHSSLPDKCPSCDAEDSFRACGPGVERLAEEVESKFPDARIAVMASDTLSGPKAAAEMVERMANREIDLLIGTQVVAKGHHFPLLTLVGVVDADLGLAGGDLRAAERTFQLLSQVAGRAGRAEHPGRVLLQTYQPDHPVMGALISGDAAQFYAEEARARQESGMPPYGKLVALILSGEDAAQVDKAAALLARSAPHGEGVLVLGPAPAPMAILRGRHRRRLLIRVPRPIAVQAMIKDWLSMQPPFKGVRVQIDIDPYSFI
ncbi:MAG TPA: primosomal protein N' [Candidatus Sulfotelmatobacter sp.]|nr:primosomal protein N' [Candidatus Sulfotelmatobacter sp.]